MINDTTRTYPRTLEQAFPTGNARMAAIEVPTPPHPHDRIVVWSSAAALMILASSYFWS
jgi:hypothetical protein